jgi:hypothetical protein
MQIHPPINVLVFEKTTMYGGYPFNRFLMSSFEWPLLPPPLMFELKRAILLNFTFFFYMFFIFSINILDFASYP